MHYLDLIISLEGEKRNMLQIRNLSKKYKGNSFYSLQNATFNVNQGDIVGLIGKNGSGKSTLLKLIAKSITPSSGTILYDNQDIYQNVNMLKDFGIMIEPVFYPDMTAVENLEFYLDLHRKKDCYDNIQKTLELVNLWEARNRKPRSFSFGMKRRMALAIALVAEPDFLLLDEPFVGLDPIGVQQLIDILQKWSKERNVSMIISSHQLGELEAICNRYIYIDEGQLAEEFETNPSSSVIVELSNNVQVLHLPESVIVKDNCHIEIPTNLSSSELNSIWYLLSKESLIKTITISETHLRDFFKKG